MDLPTQRPRILIVPPPIVRDYRISIIVFFEKYKLTIGSFTTILLVFLTILGVSLEYASNCGVNVKLWLCGTALRALLCTLIKLYAEGYFCSFRNNIDRDISLYHKLIEMLDVFGMVWFCIGNLLVFNAVTCGSEMPIIFYTSLLYICLVYIFVLLNVSLRFSLTARPPIESELAIGRGSNRNGNEITNREIDWKEWLNERNCNEGSYTQWIQNNKQSDKEIYVSCPVCLSDFNESDVENALVVSFPCHAKHLFHTTCLHSWLSTSQSRGEPTCPCCRETAVNTTS